jgi:hypothetical protein
MMLALGGVKAIGTLNSHVRGESVFSEDTTAEHIIHIVKKSAAESTEGKARCEALTARRSWRWKHRGLWVFVGDRASEGSAAKGNRCDDGQE